MSKSIQEHQKKSSASRTDWGTPQWLYNALDSMFHFTVDACANEHNHKHKNYWSEKDDALSLSWHRESSIFCNPPYGRGLERWLHKGFEAKTSGSEVVFLLPARTDTKWYHEYKNDCQTIFIKGRLRFEGAESSAQFPSMLMIFSYYHYYKKESSIEKTINEARQWHMKRK